jgi:hypothetical protein
MGVQAESAVGSAAEPFDLHSLRESSTSPGSPGGARRPFQAPVRWREVLAIVLMVGLFDLALYRNTGFAGCALLFTVAPLLLTLGKFHPRLDARALLLGVMSLLLGVRIVWLGSGLAVVVGFGLLVAFAMSLSGRRPYVFDVAAYAAGSTVAGFWALGAYCRALGRVAGRAGRPIPRSIWLNLGLPLLALMLFGSLFVLANPDVVAWVSRTVREYWREVSGLLERFSPNTSEIFFWLLVAWLTIGLLRPILRRRGLALFPRGMRLGAAMLPPPAETPLYAGVRNTLRAVIGLFAVYLVFEYKTLWFRVFPRGFYYGGYAHEGAAWLTVALAAATLLLSLIFRGSVLRDPRLGRLKRLAWIWSLENLLLAAAVFNRLHIYIDFNGLTWMRMVGLFGSSTVVAGFLIVVWKIVTGRDFAWVVQRQLWALAVGVYLFAITPVDGIVYSYNVRRVLAGDLAPSVQISVHPIDAEGYLMLQPLVACRDEIIREGIRALLAERAGEYESPARLRRKQEWAELQVAERLLLDRLRAARGDWAMYLDAEKREAALYRFHSYVYQWY